MDQRDADAAALVGQQADPMPKEITLVDRGRGLGDLFQGVRDLLPGGADLLRWVGEAGEGVANLLLCVADLLQGLADLLRCACGGPGGRRRPPPGPRRGSGRRRRPPPGPRRGPGGRRRPPPGPPRGPAGIARPLPKFIFASRGEVSGAPSVKGGALQRRSEGRFSWPSPSCRKRRWRRTSTGRRHRSRDP